MEQIDKFQYDSYGKLSYHKDALNHITAFTYDTPRHLFRLTETNTKGQTTTATWDEKCQTPEVVTDPNAANTVFSYDVFCRETQIYCSNGDYETTDYLSTGDPENQAIQKRRVAPTTNIGDNLTRDLDYFDGFGQTYRMTTTGATPNITDTSNILRAYDARGNVSWESIPLSWTAAQDASAVINAQKTRFFYDPLNRPIQAVTADGRCTTTEYEVRDIDLGGTQIAHPAVESKNELCYDKTDNSTCERMQVAMDPQGNTIRKVLFDMLATDSNDSNSGRVTEYRSPVCGRKRGASGHLWA